MARRGAYDLPLTGRKPGFIRIIRSSGFLIALLTTALLASATLSAQWQEVQFDDSDMALDLNEALSFQKYPTYEHYVEMMQRFASKHPGICRLDTFGTSVEGRLLLALEISDHPDRDEAEAGFFYTSTMHGDELVGFVLLLRLANFLLEEYGSDSEVTRLVENLSIRINPLANPDGSYMADWGTSLLNASRYTAEGIDLNRNFPAPGLGEADDTTGRALENRHMMNFLREQRFTLSANIHSGAEVVNYPWDHSFKLHADDAWYRFISREYADEAMAVDQDYMFGWPDQGITNGAEWYIVADGRQDYVNYYLEGREVTLELSNEKLLSSEYLEEFWNKNKRSLINYMSQCLYGIRGLVTDAGSGKPVRALIRIPGHDSTYSVVHSTAEHGDFYRLIKEGVYDLVVSAPGYLSDTIRGVEVVDYQATPLHIVLTADPKLGVAGGPELPELRIYPNPAANILFLDLPPISSAHLMLTITNITGQIIENIKVPNPESPLSINIEHLKTGIYIFTISSEESSHTLRFLKE